MVESGIHHGDMVMVDRSMEATYGRIVSKRMWLMAGNPDYPPTELPEGHELAIQNVVTLLIHKRG
jgi:DNA polymerase V